MLYDNLVNSRYSLRGELVVGKSRRRTEPELIEPDRCTLWGWGLLAHKLEKSFNHCCSHCSNYVRFLALLSLGLTSFSVRVSPDGFETATNSSWHLSSQFNNSSKWVSLSKHSDRSPSIESHWISFQHLLFPDQSRSKVGGMLWLPRFGHIPPISPRAPACCPNKDQGDVTKRRETDS